MSHWYTDRLMHGQPHFILLLQFCHVYISLLHVHVMFTYHCYTCMSCLPITVTRACHVYISLLHVHVMLTYHCYTCMSCFHIPVTHAIHVPCCCIHVIWLFPVTDMDIPVTGHESCWYAICEISHLLFPLYCSYCSRDIVLVFRYIVLCYQQSSGPVIMLPVSCTVVVLVTLYTWHIRS